MMTRDARRQVAIQTRRYPTFCAWGMHLFQQKHEMTDARLARWLGITTDNLYDLALCRIPQSLGAMEAMTFYYEPAQSDNFVAFLCFLIAQATTVAEQ